MTPERRRTSSSSTKQPPSHHQRHTRSSASQPSLPVAAAAPPLPSLRAASMLQHPLRAYEEEDESSYSSNSSNSRDSRVGTNTSSVATSQPSSKAKVPRTTRAYRTSTSTLAHAAESTTKSYKPRKATHVVRKEEKEELEKQLEILQAELLGLKYRALYPEMITSSQQSSNNNNSNTQSPLDPSFTGDVLRDAIKIQQLSLASVQAVISSYVRQHKVSPIQTPIRLTSDPVARKQTLQALKDAKLAEARRFLAERTRGLDMTKQFSEEERFETDEGDYCVLQFDITPLPKARSVKELFDVLFFFIFNVEIKVTETFGNVTIREDDESGDKSIAHHRLVSRNRQDVLTEVSTVHFSDFNATTCGDLGRGMVVADFIDDDALYPYRPSERLRHDLSAVLTITPERKRVKNRHDVNGPDEEEIVVVLTRWSMIKQHKPAFFIDEDVVIEMRGILGAWTDELFKAVRERAAGR